MFEVALERGGVEVRRYVVSGDVTIGRAASAQICIEDANVNRAHARLIVQGGALVIVDLDSVNGTFVDGRRLRGSERFERGSRIQIGGYTIRYAEAQRNVALEEQTGPDDAVAKTRAMPKVEVVDAEALKKALPHVRVGRHFVFVDDAQAVMPPTGRMQRLLGYKQKKGRAVKPLADAVVEIAGARIHPVPVDAQRLAGLVCDRDLYRAEQDVVRLIATMPGGGNATIRVAMNGAPLSERPIDLAKGVCIEALAMLLPGKYEAQLMVGGVDVGEPARFTVAEYTLAPLSARLLEHKLDRASQTLTVVLAVESYAVPWDRPLRGALIESGREMSEVVLTMERPGRYTGKARVVGEGPFKVRAAAVDDAARVAEVALPGTRRAERKLTLAGELGKELFVSLMPEPDAIPVRGLHVSHGDFVATPVVLEDPVGNLAVLRANEDIECLVVAAYDPARDAYSIFELGDVPRGQSASLDVPRPMCIAFVGCFVNGEPFEAFTTMFSAEKPISLDVPETVLPGAELTITVHTGRSRPVPMILCVRDERLTATDAPQSALAAATKRAIEVSTQGLGDDFRFAKLEELIEAPRPPRAPSRNLAGGIELVITDAAGKSRTEVFTQNEITIGRVAGNDLVLANGKISRRHSRIVLRDRKLIIVDLKSVNGTFVNNKRIGSPQVLKDNDRITVGDFTLTLNAGDGGLADPGQPLFPRSPPPSPAHAMPQAMDDMMMDDERVMLDQDDAGPEMEPAVPARARPAAAPPMRSLAAEDALFDEDPGEMSSAAVPSIGAADVADDFDARAERAVQTATRELRLSKPAANVQNALSAKLVDTKPAAPTEAAPVRATFPEVLFCAVVEVGDGEQIRVPAGEGLGAFAVEAFFVDGGDFGEARARVQVDKPVRVDLDVAPEIDPEDRVVGVLRLACKSGSARVSLVRDGRAVSLRTVDGRVVAAADALPSGMELVFDAGPGLWLATVEDPASGEIDSMEVRVGTPGVYRSLVREIVLLDRGKKLMLDGDMLSLRVLPGIDEPFHMLAEATAGYGHMCCEQTAAKILSATVMFLTADTAALRQKAEEIILAGIARERSMLRGRGFAMYPEQSQVSDYYTPKVVQYLWSLDGLADVQGLSRQLTDAVREGLRMADDVAPAWSLKRVPDRVESIEDAYAVAIRDPRRQREALEHVARIIAVDEKSGPRVRAPSHRVAERATLSYAAAVLFASGKTQTAMRLANDVLRQLNEQGRLYSTVDSVAAIALMVQLRKTGIIGGAAEIVVNGKSTTALAASLVSDQAEVVEVKEGVCVVEVTRAREDRWADARSTFPLKVGFRDDSGRSLTRFRRGDKAELVVTLPKGYSEGDLVHVCLPPAMAWLEGGGRVKRFSADFEGRDEVRIPVVVTHTISGRQRFAVAVRNMFQEERAATPGLMVIEGA